MYIYIITFGDVEKRVLFSTLCEIKRVFRCDVRASMANFPIREVYNARRKQYSAHALLDYISRLNYPQLLKLLALVSFDLYVEGMNFVFGLAQLGGRNALVSTYRLCTQKEDLFFERLHKEVIHELGHTFGLPHCSNPLCVMSFSNSVYHVDQKNKGFCPECERLLNLGK